MKIASRATPGGLAGHGLSAIAIGQSHGANLRIPCSVKTSQCRVRKCVHEGKPRATNRSRVNPITMQCKVDKRFAKKQIDNSPVGFIRFLWVLDQQFFEFTLLFNGPRFLERIGTGFARILRSKPKVRTSHVAVLSSQSERVKNSVTTETCPT